jgi:molecular chaperone DnaJ/curved DNA-binding protein
VEYKDYYKILGVNKGATDKEIKSAYRKLARKYHPDVNPGNTDAEAKFKEINEANAVLSDPEKRKKYDALGSDWYRNLGQARSPGGATTTYSTTGSAADFSDFFETLFGQRGGTATASTPGGFDFDLGSLFGRGRGKSGQPAQRGSDAEQPIDVTLQEAFEGSQRAFTLQLTETCPTCHGAGVVKDALCPTCNGTGTVMRTERLSVKIPKGVREGSRIRISGKGNPGAGGGASGDLFLVVHMVPDNRFRRDGDDLATDVAVPFTTLVLGGEITVPTLGGSVTMRVPPGSQNGRTLRLAGQGMPALRSDTRGNLYVKLQAVLPTTINERQRELFQELAQAGA